MMRISWTEHRTNQSFLDELSTSHRFLTTIQARRKLKYFGHVVRAENLSTDILHGRINGKLVTDLVAGRNDTGQMM